MTRHPPASTSTSGGSGRRRYVERHGRAIGADVAHDHEIADFDRRQLAVARKRVGALAHRADDVGGDGVARRAAGPVRCGETRRRAPAASARSSRVEHDELARAFEVLDVDDARDEHAGRADQDAARFEQRRETRRDESG